MKRRPLAPAERYDRTWPRCWWGCGTPVGTSPFRTPMLGTPGGGYTVCGPDCPNRPGGVIVVTRPSWQVVS